MRAFLGVPVPDQLKPRIIQIQDGLDDFDIKSVEKENLHFNLKFFGEIENEKVDKIKEIVEKVAAQFEPFEINVNGIGAFPSKSYVKVVWLGIKEGFQTFKSLGDMIENSLVNLGIEKEEDFTPHLTLGRVKSGRNKTELLVFLRKYEKIEVGKMTVDKLTLFQSKLSPKGPVYEEVFTVKLG
jgi:2'-5' RNA ligase